VFENVVSLHKGSSDPGLGFTGGREVDPFFGARGIKRIARAGRVMAETLNGRGFDYMGYDNTPMWTSSTATVSQREFIYLHGSADSEFVVVFDRFNATNPSTDEKVWKICADAARVRQRQGRWPRVGQWVSHDSDTIALTNKFDGPEGRSSGRRRRTAGSSNPSATRAGHQFPRRAGMEFQSGDGDGTTPWARPR
jgi:hypothetical protein